MAQEKYAVAYAKYSGWLGQLETAISTGKSAHLDENADFLQRGQDAGNAAKEFVEYVDQASKTQTKGGWREAGRCSNMNTVSVISRAVFMFYRAASVNETGFHQWTILSMTRVVVLLTPIAFYDAGRFVEQRYNPGLSWNPLFPRD